MDTAFAVINPAQEDVLYTFVLTWVSGEPRTAISHRNLDNWAELKDFLKNSYIEKTTLIGRNLRYCPVRAWTRLRCLEGVREW